MLHYAAQIKQQKNFLIKKKKMHLLYEVDIIVKEFDAQEKVKGHVSSPFLGLLLPSIRSHFGEFGIRFKEEKLCVCVALI